MKDVNFAGIIIIVAFILTIPLYIYLSHENKEDAKYCHYDSKVQFQHPNRELLYQKQGQRCCSFVLKENQIEREC